MPRVDSYKFLHPKQLVQEQIASEAGEICVYTVPRVESDDSVDGQISLSPILIWNGRTYDIQLENIPKHLDKFFVNAQTIRGDLQDDDDDR